MKNYTCFIVYLYYEIWRAASTPSSRVMSFGPMYRVGVEYGSMNEKYIQLVYKGAPTRATRSQVFAHPIQTQGRESRRRMHVGEAAEDGHLHSQTVRDSGDSKPRATFSSSVSQRGDACDHSPREKCIRNEGYCEWPTKEVSIILEMGCERVNHRRNRRHGADPPKNKSDRSSDSSHISVRTGSDYCCQDFFHLRPWNTPKIGFTYGRSLCSSAAMVLSVPHVAIAC